MIDIIMPQGNEAEFIEAAEALGINGLCFLYTNTRQFYRPDKFQTFNGLLNTQGRADIIVADGSKNSRRLFEKEKPDVVFNLEMQEKDYMHHRGSGLEHVTARLSAKNKLVIAFSFSQLLEAEGIKRAELMGRMMQNIMLCRKFKVETAIASFARSPLQLRSPHDLKSFFEELGMTSAEAENSLKAVGKRITLNRSKP